MFASFIASSEVSIFSFVASTSDCIDFNMSPISLVAYPVCSDSFLISSATTENPLPASPALAASIAAFNANRLVCSEIPIMVLNIVPIEFDFTSKELMFSATILEDSLVILNLSTISFIAFEPSSLIL